MRWSSPVLPSRLRPRIPRIPRRRPRTSPRPPLRARSPVSWTAPADATGITAYDLRYIRSNSHDKTDSQWTLDIGDFDGERTNYEAIVGEGVTRTTVEAVSLQRRTKVVIEPPDADGNPDNGHRVDLEGLAAITVSVTSANGSRTRVYRLQLEAPPVELTLAPTWTSIEWPGADGMAIADALRQAGILDEVLAIYRWDEATGAWLAYFPAFADVPGINTLTTLEPGHTYCTASASTVVSVTPAVTVPSYSVRSPENSPISTPLSESEAGVDGVRHVVAVIHVRRIYRVSLNQNFT